MSSNDRYAHARSQLVDEARALVKGEHSTEDFSRAFRGLVPDLEGGSGPYEPAQKILSLIEAWESSVGEAKMGAAARLTAQVAEIVPPESYREPILVWVVEYTDVHEPGEIFHAGAFTSEVEAGRLLTQLESDACRSSIWVGMVAVHETLEDWEWDR